MRIEVITERDDLVIRRAVLAPGEATPWHVDPCHRFTVVVRGDGLRLEYRGTNGKSDEPVDLEIHPGLADWEEPTDRVHRAINTGSSTYEEVVTFFLESPGSDPQPEASTEASRGAV